MSLNDNNKKNGRPKIREFDKRGKRLEIRLTIVENEKLKAVALNEDSTKSAVVIKALNEYLDKNFMLSYR